MNLCNCWRICVVAGVCLALAHAVVWADGPPAAQENLRAQHKETPDDQPARQADILEQLADVPHEELATTKTSPAPLLAPLTPPFIVWGGFESVQVNVDANGNNIPNDAANEPSIAVDPTDPDKMAIGWRQFDTINNNFRQAGWGYSQDGGWSWTFPGVLTPGTFRSDPVLDSDTDGNFYYYSLDGSMCCQFFISDDGGQSWSAPIWAYGGDKEWFGIDRTGGIGQGNIYTTWNERYRCTTGDFTRSTDGGHTFPQSMSLPGDPFWGTFAVGPQGEVYISSANMRVIKSTNAQDPHASPAFNVVGVVNLGGDISMGEGPNPGGLLGQVWIRADHSSGPSRGHLYVLASVDPPGADPMDVMISRSTNGGATWEAPVRVNDDPPGTNTWQWFGTMSVAPSGRIDAIWNDTRNGGGNYRLSELYYASSTDGGKTWSKNIAVSPQFDSHVGWPRQNKLGDYYDMVSDDSGADVAYAATFNNEQDIYYLRIQLGCTGNETIKKAKCKQKHGVNKMTVRLKGGIEGDSFTVELSSGQKKEGSLNSKGKGKGKFRDLPSGGGTATATWGCGAEDVKDYACP